MSHSLSMAVDEALVEAHLVEVCLRRIFKNAVRDKDTDLECALQLRQRHDAFRCWMRDMAAMQYRLYELRDQINDDIADLVQSRETEPVSP